jgi:predicted DNA-binding transcriptional regulator AlpA
MVYVASWFHRKGHVMNPVDKRYLNCREAATFLNMSKKWSDKERAAGRGPRALRFGHAVRYDIEELVRFAESRAEGPIAA